MTLQDQKLGYVKNKTKKKENNNPFVRSINFQEAYSHVQLVRYPTQPKTQSLRIPHY